MSRGAYELQPIGHGHEGGAGAEAGGLTKQTVEGMTWREVFYELARLDGEVGEEEGDEPSINIAKLKEHFSSQPSYMLEQRTGMPRYRLVYIADKAST